MTSVYPGAFDNFPTNKTNATPRFDVLAPQVNDLADAINRIETTLGTNPTFGTTITPYYNVKNAPFNAVGDGVTDDTAAFQSAINTACANKGVVYVPPVSTSGYLISTLSIPSPGDLKIIGDGAQSKLKHKSGTDRCLIYQESFAGTVSRANVWIEGLNFIGTGQGVGGGGNNQRGAMWLDNISNVVVKNNIITDFRDVGLNIWPIDRALVYGNRFERCTTSSEGWNIINWCNLRVGNQDTVGDFVIANNYVSNTTTGGICASYNSPSKPTTQLRAYVMNNTVKDCGWVGIALENSYCQDVIISENEIYFCWNGIEVGTGGNTQFATPQPNYVIVTDNIVDQQGRSTGSTGTTSGMSLTGSRILATNNLLRVYRSGILIDRSDSDSFADDVVVNDNTIEYGSNSDTSIVNQALNLVNMRGGLVANNQIHRWKTVVKGNQTVGAGGNLAVGTVEGMAPTGSIVVNGTTYAYTAVIQAGQLTNAFITITAGGTFTDAQQVLSGGCGTGMRIADTKDLLVTGNVIRNPGQSGIGTGGTGGQNISIVNNYIIDPWSQNAAGTKCGMTLSASGATDTRVEGNYIYQSSAGGPASATIGINADGGETRTTLLNNFVDGIATAYSFANAPLLDRGNRKSKTHVPNGGFFSSTPGAVSTLNIAHGLTAAPTLFNVQGSSATTRTAPAFSVTATATNLVLTFQANLTAATVYDWNWTAQV